MSGLARISYDLYKKGKVTLDDIKVPRVRKEVEDHIASLEKESNESVENFK